MDSRERSGLKDIINTLREGNNTLIDTISGGRLKDEKLMETVTKVSDVESEENGLIKNIQTTQNALGVLRENLILIKKNLDKFKNNKEFMKLVEDLVINFPDIDKSDYQTLMQNKQKEILMLNNICLSTMHSSYQGITEKA